ncbi:phosphoribosylanthranilate isomerase [Haloarcula japonica]|uniref:phosphoribosylanthranilate isomerase n=1 Tax=Haloarcula japonica TaxID=29282 RepID=UPI0039F65AD5
MTRVKICGVTDEKDRDAVVAAGADAVGVIHGVPVDTPREVNEATAERLADGIPPFVTSVLVTMPTTVQEAVRRIDSIEPDAVQVHDGLSPAELGALDSRITQNIVAVVEAGEPAIKDYAAHADALLVDSVDADGGGGTGETHDWERTRDLVDSLDAPVVLAGGLTPESVGEAIETAEPFAVDVASGVESSGGKKDHDAVERFVRNAKRASEGAV